MARIGGEVEGRDEFATDTTQKTPRRQPADSPGLRNSLSKLSVESFGPKTPLNVMVLPLRTCEVVLAPPTIWLAYVPSVRENMT